MDLEIACGYEGSNPQDPGLIEWSGEDRVRVCPESEDGDSNYKFAFDVTVHNSGASVRPLHLDIDWREPPTVGTRYMAARASVFVQHEGSGLQEAQGELDGDHARFRLRIPPGSTRLGLHPPFGRRELEAFFAQAAALDGARRITFGQTAEGRPLEAAVLPALGTSSSAALGIGRLHPYESAGSFCIWGVLDLLASPSGEPLRRERTFVLVPVANPDGVAHGLCKRTAWGGVNLSAEGNESSDPAACALRGLIAGLASTGRRSLLLDAHGWMNREDGLWVYRRDLERAIVGQLRGERFPNGWRTTLYEKGVSDVPRTDLRRYAAQQLRMEPVVTSIPWYGRSPVTMRQIGGMIAEVALDALG
jgi:hypothetical protein